MIVERAFLELYPEKQLGKYKFSLKYSGHFKGYNANVTKYPDRMEFKLSKEWRKIGDEVKLGLIQSLMNKIFKTKVKTQNIDLYEIFLRKVHIAVRKDKVEEYLLESFNRVNDKYFHGTVEMPNLVWGTNSTTKLGSYDYGSDTISISTIFKDSPIRLLDFVMHHEMLHKKHKFYSKNGKSYHHTREFLKEEKKFDDFDNLDKELGRFVRMKKGKRKGFFW